MRRARRCRIPVRPTLASLARDVRCLAEVVQRLLEREVGSRKGEWDAFLGAVGITEKAEKAEKAKRRGRR